jgi:hypothetical protein
MHDLEPLLWAVESAGSFVVMHACLVKGEILSSSIEPSCRDFRVSPSCGSGENVRTAVAPRQSYWCELPDDGRLLMPYALNVENGPLYRPGGMTKICNLPQGMPRHKFKH